jgi:aromatic-L-amino-acid decarboxylase
MTREEFRRRGHAMIDWIASYLDNVEQHPVRSQARPGDVRARLPGHPPQTGEPWDAIMRDVERIIIPGLTHWQSPSFFGFFPANISEPAILGELLSAGLGVQGMLWNTSPACTELETHVLEWLAQMLGLPARFLSHTQGGGVIQDTASSATLCALLAARERATRLASNERGLHAVAPRLTAYASSQAHSSVEKAVKIAGLGRENLRLIDVDATHRMRPARLEAAIREDLERGLMPCFVCGTVGTTSSGAVDPLQDIAAICRRSPAIWLHVDAAMMGTAAICEEHRWCLEGVDQADSLCVNPHKWMLTNFDCDCFFVADRAALINAMSVVPEYLRNAASESGAVFDYRDWQIPLGRRFRALKLWFVIRHYGVEGLQAHVRHHIALATEFASWVRDDDRFEVAAPPAFNLVCFRHRDGDEFNRRLLDALNDSGRLFLTHTKLDDRFTLRMCIGQTRTRREHVERAWRQIHETADSMTRA